MHLIMTAGRVFLGFSFWMVFLLQLASKSINNSSSALVTIRGTKHCPWIASSCSNLLQFFTNSVSHWWSASTNHDMLEISIQDRLLLPVRQRITYKILLLTYKALNGMAPKYIADLLQPYTPTRQLQSSSKNLLVTPKSNLKFYGDRSFQVAAPRLWNSLTDDIRSIQNLDVFKNKIKTLLFREAFS